MFKPATVNKANAKSSNSAPFQRENESEAFIRPKLNIGKPNDKYEVEADRMADHVVNKKPVKTPLVQKKENSEEEELQLRYSECEQEEQVQRMSDDDEDTLQMRSKGERRSPNIENQLNASKGGGRPMEEGIRSEMEAGFGAGFGNVRIHENSDAVQMSQQLNAQAFTNGNDIYFNNGKYNTSSSQGKYLLAHELTHTIQQSKTNQTIQRMRECPSTEGGVNQNFWQTYHGDSSWFHCGFNGYLERRSPTPSDPQNECFYDTEGILVDESHPYSYCGGTPNQYDSAEHPLDHTFIDSGGIVRAGIPAFIESRRYQIDQITLPIRQIFAQIGEEIAISILAMREYVNPSIWEYRDLPNRSRRHLNMIGMIASWSGWERSMDDLLNDLGRPMSQYLDATMIREIHQDITNTRGSSILNIRELRRISLPQLILFLSENNLLHFTESAYSRASEAYSQIRESSTDN